MGGEKYNSMLGDDVGVVGMGCGGELGWWGMLSIRGASRVQLSD